MESAFSTTTDTIASATDVAVRIQTPGDTFTRFSFSGSYTGVTGVFEASHDGTTYYPVRGWNEGTGALVTSTVTPGSNASVSYIVPAPGFKYVRFRATAWSTLEATVTMSSGVLGGYFPYPTS